MLPMKSSTTAPNIGPASSQNPATVQKTAVKPSSAFRDAEVETGTNSASGSTWRIEGSPLAEICAKRLNYPANRSAAHPPIITVIVEA
jgi:hypothetical protein